MSRDFQLEDKLNSAFHEMAKGRLPHAYREEKPVTVWVGRFVQSYLLRLILLAPSVSVFNRLLRESFTEGPLSHVGTLGVDLVFAVLFLGIWYLLMGSSRVWELSLEMDGGQPKLTRCETWNGILRAKLIPGTEYGIDGKKYGAFPGVSYHEVAANNSRMTPRRLVEEYQHRLRRRRALTEASEESLEAFTAMLCRIRARIKGRKSASQKRMEKAWETARADAVHEGLPPRRSHMSGNIHRPLTENGEDRQERA